MFKKLLVLAASFAILLGFSASTVRAAGLTGAIFTTDSTCTGVNINIYGSKDAVYLDGGPHNGGSAGLPDGSYYVQVTEPNGTLLGTSVGSGNDTPVVVSGGEFDHCYQLSAILIRATDSTPGYDTTGNPGGEYKVWVSSVSTFDNNLSKTDNFKVKGTPETPPPTAILHVRKFYDTNADGIRDSSENDIIGWKFEIHNGIDFIRYTLIDMILDPDLYTVTEFYPIQTNWVPTTSGTQTADLKTGDKTLQFGNVCTGAGGGKTLGFWSNKNGQALFGADDLALMVSLNLCDGNGSNFDPANYGAFRSWLLGAKATNMAYMLSAQLSAMELNVFNGKVSGSALVYAPQLLPFHPTSLNALGFISITDLMSAANAELGSHGLTPSGNAFRASQEALKNALDAANNNTTFVQPSACPFSFE